MPKSLKEQLIELREQNNPAAVLDLIYEREKKMGLNYNEAQEMEDFWQETKSDEKYNTFLLDLMDVYTDRLLETCYRYGLKFEEIKAKIKNDEIPEMQLFKDDIKVVNKITNDILNTQYSEYAMFDIVSRNINQIFSKGINKIFDFEENESFIEPVNLAGAEKKNSGPKVKPFLINGQNGLDILKNKLHEKRKVKAKEFGITEQQLLDYQMRMNDQDLNHLGFVVKQQKPAEGESYFESVPKFVKRLDDAKTSAEIDAYEDEVFDKADEYVAYTKMCRSSVNILKHLYKEFQRLENEAQNSSVLKDLMLSENYHDTVTNLEKATHLGTDYILNDPNVSVKKPSKDFNFIDIENAMMWIGGSPDNLYDEIDAKIKEFQNAGITTGKDYDLLVDFKNASANLCNLKILFKKKNKECEKADVRPHNLADAQKTQKYIERARKSKGFITDENRVPNNYIDTLDEQANNLCDSIMNDLADSDDYNNQYEKLLKLMEKNKRLYERMESSKRTKFRHKESELESTKRRTADFEENCRQINEQIALCKEFENTFNDPAQIRGKSMDRLKLLDRISKTISRQAVTLDENKKSFTWNNQASDLDTLWFANQYANMFTLKKQGDQIPEQYREKLGFNLYGDATREDEKEAKIYLYSARNYYTPNKTIEEYINLIEQMAFLKAKVCVNSGKDYYNIAQALNGQENSELKAKYLYNSYASYDMLFDEYLTEDFHASFIDTLLKGGIDKLVDLDDKDTTCDDLLFSLGFTEEDMQRQYKQYPNLRSAKLSDIIDSEDPASFRRNVCEYVVSLLYTKHSKIGNDKAVARMSSLEKKYYSLFAQNKSSEKNNFDYSKINGWIKEEGEKISKDLDSVMLAEKMQRVQVSLTSKKLMGVDPKSEVGRFYYNKLREEDTYVSALLKDKKEPKKIIKDIISERKNERLAKFSVKKLPVNYDTYIVLHTAERAGETTDEMVDNLAKCLAASALKAQHKPFSVKSIRNAAEEMKKLLVLDVLKSDPNRLREALRGEDTVKRIGNELRYNLFSVKPESEKKFFSEMERLHSSMPTSKWRSSKYKEFYNAVNALSDIKSDKSLTPEKRKSAIRNANIRIYRAILNYTEGKEKLQGSSESKDSFENALDAMAIIEKYVPGFKVHTQNLLNKINSVRNNNNPDAPDYISHNDFTKKYGADHSWNLLSAKRAKLDQKQRKRISSSIH